MTDAASSNAFPTPGRAADSANGADDDLDATAAPSFDAARFRQVLGHFPTGVTIVTAMADGKPVGLSVNSFCSVSLDPPLVLFCPDRASTSWPSIEAAGVFCVNVLADDQEHLSRVFASKVADKFEGVGWKRGLSGAPVIDDTLAVVECRIERVADGGDHYLVIGRVLDLAVGRVEGERGPLVFYRGGYGRFQP